VKVIGTAGHVDHGKSTLVQALTGIDPDRLAEEKAREMTIDLGFAWLTLPNGESVGVVDVPGHIDFIKNMLAGVGAIDAALFVIAADEGAMPQTKEHLAILDLLDIAAGVVALTKIDLVEDDPEWMELVEVDVADLLSETCLADAPIVPLSARTGQGLQELVGALQAALDHAPQRRNLSRPRLPIDRAFTIAGFGTIVTGTLVDGELQVGQEVEIAPAGLKARIRGLQTHKQKIERAVPGSRVAVNLSGVSKEDISRGDVVCLPGTVKPTVLVDVQLRMVADSRWELRHNQLVDFFVGAAEVQARTRLLNAHQIKPGETGWVQLRLSQPVALQRGDRFILRLPSPSHTLGGGMVVNPYPGRRWRRFRPEVVAMLEAFHSDEPTRVFLETLRREEPASYGEVLASSSLVAQQALEACRDLLANGQVVVLDRDWWQNPAAEASSGPLMTELHSLMTTEGWRDLQQRMAGILSAYHQQYPLRSGMPREELKSRLQGRRRRLWSLRRFNDIMGKAASEGLLKEEGSTVRAAQHQVVLSPDQQDAVDRLSAAFAANPYAPPSVADSISQVGEDLFAWLVDSGELIRVGDDVVFAAEAYQEMVDRVVDRLQEEGSITVAQVRDMFGASRKYALALMEFLDSQRITRRVGDQRVLRKI
jgi:selenocysteine-specific elongation factor